MRRWLTAAAGPSFRFDGAMREFFAAADGYTTLGDAVVHWHRTRSEPARAIDPQFELNRFSRQCTSTTLRGCVPTCWRPGQGTGPCRSTGAVGRDYVPSARVLISSRRASQDRPIRSSSRARVLSRASTVA